MSSVINSNIASLNAQRNLDMSKSGLTTALQRLSSGLRINSAKDDAAGLAIASRFSTQINGLNQAVRNANDGISLAQTGEAALNEVTNNLQRIRELAVQSANATNSTSDRAAIDLEVQQRLSEIDRTAAQTTFNGTKLLDGSFGSATFQIGANAGETIAVNLAGNVRLSGTGAIATLTASTALGASATDGHIDTIPAAGASALNFGTAGAAASAGSKSVTANTFNFAAAVASTSSPQAVTTGTDFSTAGSAQVDGKNVQTPTAFDFSGTGLAQFNVDGHAVTLTTNTTNGAGLASAIQTQLQSVDPTYTAGFSGGNLTITHGGSTTAVAITSADANAVTAGFANSAGTAGTAAVATTNATMTIDGTNITLNGNDASAAAVAAELTTKMQASALGANYSAAIVSGNLVISHASSTTAVAITNADAKAVTAGFANTAGVAGSAAGTPATMTIDGHSVTLNQNYGSFNNLTAAIDTQLNTVPGTYTITNTAGAINIARSTTGAGSAAVNITASDANGISAGFTVANGTAGTNAVTSTNATFYVDGTKTVTLNSNYTNDNAGKTSMAAAIQTALGSGYTSTYDNTSGKITMTKTGSTAAVNITGADTNATSAGFGFASGTAGVTGGSVTLSNFTINGTSMAGTYTTNQKLADAINAGVSNVYATISGGALKLSSSADITLGGAEATATTGAGHLGFSSASITSTTGNLLTANVTTVANALETIQRIDSTLTTVSTLRSTFGSIQNRFDSVIANLSAASENASAARSRIQDADYAQETAALTRGQILQQAGTAMLAQANSLPNGVLALLR